MDSEEVVELVHPDGRVRGSMAKLAAHEQPGALHRAVSLVALDGDDRVLLQRRSAGKYHFPGRWSNTCCTHPRVGEPSAAAAARRAGEELGLVVAPAQLRSVGALEYRAADPASGLVEHELDEVFVVRVDEPLRLRPDPDEVDAVRFTDLASLRRDLAAAPEGFTPWTPLVLRQALGDDVL